MVQITSPTSGSTVSGTISVSASVTSPVAAATVVGVQFKLDGVNLGAEVTAPPYSTLWDTTTASNGSHTLTAVARDTAGNRSTSDPVTVTVSNDTTPPTVSITSPSSGSTVAGTTAVTASASDNVGVAGVQFRVDGANIGAEVTTAPYSIAWDTTTASNGSHTLTAVARDAAGNRTTSAPVSVTVSNAPSGGTPPTVAITSPASGATVSGTITVTASASDNVGVAGVQFRLDGVNRGAEVTTPPYSIAWNTTTAADGSHVLTAVARNAAGSSTTSSPVTVTVSNAAAAPKRFEETDPSITYTPGWTQDATRSWSGGTAAVSTTVGARATFTFTGSSVSWIGGRTPGTGIARIFLDGVFVTELDTYSKTEEIRVPMFAANGLANTSHTLAIEVTGLKNLSSTSTLVIVDAFDVPAQTITRLQETDPAVSYTLGWTQGNTPNRAWSAGTAAVSAAAGAQATFSFKGTAISWVGARGNQSGIARVSLDGVFVTEVDLYSSTEQIQAAVFTATGLADASHTLMIEATGRQNAASLGNLVVVDAFDVTSTGTRHQETDPAITYGAGWILGNRDKAYNEGATAESNTPGAQASFTFTGTAISWIAFSGPQTGIARVFLDGVFVTDIDTYATTEGPQHMIFSASGLAAGSHTLTVQVIGKNFFSSDFWILVDAFDVTP